MPWGAIGGAAIGAIGSLIGGHMNNSASAANAAQQYAQQKEFAQNGVRWKVADAQAAGIHPLAALGAQTFSYNPVMTQYDNGISEALGRMGQGVTRAVEAKQLAEERAAQQDLRQKQGQLVDAQIAKTNAEANFVNQQAAQSANAVAKTAAPPPMPKVNGKASQSSGPFWDADLVSHGFRVDEQGKKIDFVPSQALKDRVEDVFGVEWMPFVEAAIDNFKAKVLKQNVRGYHWDDKRQELVKGDRPVARQNSQKPDYYYPRSYR